MVKTKKEQIDKKIHAQAEEPFKAETDQTLESLRTALDAKEKEARENYDRYVRSVAELDNYRKRAARETGRRAALALRLVGAHPPTCVRPADRDRGNEPPLSGTNRPTEGRHRP